MNKKLLVVCGPTATGKTSLAIHLAKKFDGELVSADSRQVYKKMDIGTGKEWGDVAIWGYDLVEPEKDYSVSQFFKFAEKKIKNIQKRKKLPILVGGTGLYIKSVIDGIPTISVPRSKSLRSSLDLSSVEELFDRLATLDSSKAASLNLSDKKNPRRLIRAIEVAQWNLDNESKLKKAHKKIYDSLLFIGLKLDIEKLAKKISKRVEQRLNNGFIFEIESLLRSGVSWKNQSMDALGYSEAEEFLKKGLGYEEFVEKWTKGEVAYAKRQINWFKRDKRIHWFDIDDSNYPDSVEKLVKRWYLNRN